MKSESGFSLAIASQPFDKKKLLQNVVYQHIALYSTALGFEKYLIPLKY